MPIQYIQDNNGFTTAVIIPIDEWKLITNRHGDLKLMEQKPVPKVEKHIKASDFAGTLSHEGYQAINKHIENIRKEWDRDTF